MPYLENGTLGKKKEAAESRQIFFFYLLVHSSFFHSGELVYIVQRIFPEYESTDYIISHLKLLLGSPRGLSILVTV